MFPISTPSSVGVRSAGIIRFLDEMKEKRLHLHKLMILRHGQLIAKTSFAPWTNDKPHMLFSLTKSFTSTAVGFAVQDGLLRVTDHLVDFFPEYLPSEPCGNMKKITVKHLLTMNTGHRNEPPMRGENWERGFMQSYVEFEPGTHFMYNTCGTYMLAAIVQKVTGRKLLDYLREKLMDPLGMSRDIWFDESPTGVAQGGHGLAVGIEDIAKLGQFYLQRGKWEGKQLLNEQWILDAQTPWSDNSHHTGTVDWRSGYGYQFWKCSPDDIFRGDGAFGQYCIIMPGRDMVIAINSGLDNMGAVLTSIWENILPAVDAPCDPGEDDLLKARLAETITPAAWEEEGIPVSEPVPEITPDAVTFLHDDRPLVCPLSHTEWKLTENGNTAVRAARTEDGLILHQCHILTPFEDVMKFRFTEHGVEILAYHNRSMKSEPTQEILGYRR